MSAHITFERIHRVFSLLKRQASGTFHGFREKHLDVYLNEFVFRWKHRRHFATTMDAMLGLAMRKPPMPYKAIAGDTREWREAHRKAILVWPRSEAAGEVEGGEPDMLLEMARLLRLAGDLDKALVFADSAPKVAPDCAEAQQMRAPPPGPGAHRRGVARSRGAGDARGVGGHPLVVPEGLAAEEVLLLARFARRLGARGRAPSLPR